MKNTVRIIMKKVPFSKIPESVRLTPVRNARMIGFVFVMTVMAVPVFGQLYEYRFNDTGTESTGSGTDKVKATLVDEGGTPADLHGPAGSGVSGQAADLAFDNTASPGLGGDGGRGGKAELPASEGLDNLSSFTIQGWYAIRGSENFQGARLFEKRDGPTAVISLFLGSGANKGSLTLALGTPGVSEVANAVSEANRQLGSKEAWVFFAVTYDGTRDQDNVKFYAGGVTERIEQIGQASSLSTGSLGQLTGAAVFGNNKSGNRPLRGLLDNFRIFGVVSRDGGVLSLEQLENLRAADVSNAASH